MERKGDKLKEDSWQKYDNNLSKDDKSSTSSSTNKYEKEIRKVGQNC